MKDIIESDSKGFASIILALKSCQFGTIEDEPDSLQRRRNPIPKIVVCESVKISDGGAYEIVSGSILAI